MTPSWLGEPLLHFAILGLLIFFVDRALAPGVDQNAVIAIDATLKANLAAKFAQSTRRDPMPEELDQMVEGWIQKEVLYREGVALGLDRSDGLVRDRVISLVRALTINAVAVDAPTETGLREYFKAKQDKYVLPRRYDLAHYIIGSEEPDPRAQAETLLDALSAGGESTDIARRLMRVEGRSAAQLEAIFGAEFPDQVDAMPVGRWAIARSVRGWHVLRIDSIAPRSAPAFGSIRKRVEDDWRQEQKLKQAARHYRDMRANYKVITVDDNG